MTKTHTRSGLPRLLALVGSLGLVASACGSGTTNDVAAEADIVGVAGNFCDAVAELGATIDSGSSAEARASAASATVDLMPDGAPDFAIRYFGAIAQSTQLNASGDDASTAEAAWASGQHLQVSSFLGAVCPGDDYASSSSFQAMVATGLDLQAGGAMPAAESTGETVSGGDDSAAVQPDSTQSDSTQPGETAPAPSTAVTNDLGESGNSAVYNMTEFVAGPAYATNASLESLFGDTQEVSNKNWVVVDVLGETLANINTSFPSGVFFLIDPDGRSVSATRLSDNFGESMYDLGFNGKENQGALVIFETTTLVTSLDGWQLKILIADEIPAFIPLSGPSAPALEPLALDAVDGGETTTSDNYYNGNLGCVSTLDIDVISAVVSVETSYQSQLHRSRTGERFLTIEADITNTTDESIHELCDEVGLNFDDPQFRLLIDGRKSGPTSLGITYLEPGGTETIIATFTIDRDVAEISLLGEADEDVLGTWQVDFPTLPGE